MSCKNLVSRVRERAEFLTYESMYASALGDGCFARVHDCGRVRAEVWRLEGETRKGVRPT
jgi:hypothetical protein